MYQINLEGIAIYNSDVYEVTNKTKGAITSPKNGCSLRRSRRILKSEHISNDIIKMKMDVEENIIDRVEMKRLVWNRHLNRVQDHR